MIYPSEDDPSDAAGSAGEPSLSKSLFGEPESTRASDQDRDKVASILRSALAEARISHEELSERLEGAYRAMTFGDLVSVISDLPLRSLGVEDAPMTNADFDIIHPKYRFFGQNHRVRILVMTDAICVAVWVLTGAHGQFWPGWVLLGTGISLTGGIRKIKRN